MSEAAVSARGRLNVTIRPATIRQFTQMPIHGTSKRRIAAYARVSTDSEEQLNSYDAQVRHYTQYIKSREDWEFVDVYTDEGISGLRLAKRDGFNRMIADAMDGKIDLIIAKSISRFARNTVDTLNMVRMLKAKGVEVYFEKENIYTFDAKGEVLITIMASLAQEESRSISENVTWGKRKRFAEGEFSLPYKRFLGYEKGEDGRPRIVEKEASIVRRIYSMFVDGLTPVLIADELTMQGIPTPGNKKTWQSTTVDSILTNEKYKGDAILQKSFTLDFLQGHRKTNDGELPQYHFSGTHEPIIEPEIFEYVQRELARRRTLGRSYSGRDIFASRIICADCGGIYGGKVWGSNTKYRRMVWRCNRKYIKGEAPCTTPHITEDEMKSAFMTVFNRLLPDREQVISVCEEAMSTVLNTAPLERDHDKLLTQLDELGILLRTLVKENAGMGKEQDDYATKYNDLLKRYEAVQLKAALVEQQIADKDARRGEIGLYLDALRQSGEVITEFDRRLWNMTIDTVTVHKDKKLVFRFKDGREYTWA